jgi:hypothetical protein
MPVIIDYRIKLDGAPLEGAVEFTGDLLPKPGDSFRLTVGDRKLDTVVAEAGELSPYRGRLHLRIRFKDYPVRGLRRAIQLVVSALTSNDRVAPSRQRRANR